MSGLSRVGYSLICFLMMACHHQGTVLLPPLEERAMQEFTCTPPILSPSTMFMSAGRIVIYQEKADSPLLVFPTPFSGTGYYEGTRGRGPGEFTFPDLNSFEVGPDGFSYFEQGGIEKRFAIDESGHFHCIDSKQIMNDSDILNGVKRISTGLLNVNLDMSSNYEFVLTRSDGTTNLLSEYPDIVIDDGEFKPFHFLKTLAIHPDKSRFAAFYAFEPLVRIISSEGAVLKEIALPLEGAKKEPAPNPVCFSGGVCADDNFILAKFADTEFFLFDWEGRFLKRIHVDSPVSLFTYDFANDILYTVASCADDFSMMICKDFLGGMPIYTQSPRSSRSTD